MSKRYYREATHTCKARGCMRQIARKFLMCRDHWLQVPETTRQEVWDAYNEMQSLGTMTIRYARAVASAVESIGRTYPLDNPPQDGANPVQSFE